MNAAPTNGVNTSEARPRTLAEKVWDAHLVDEGRGRRRPTSSTSTCTSCTRSRARRRSTACASAGRPVRRPDLTIATEDHNTPTLDIDKPIADLTSRTQIETLRRNAEGVRRPPALARRQRAGHRARRRPAARPHAARHHRRVRRLAHVHARRVRRDGVRHRHERGRARARHADAAAEAVQDHGDQRRGRAPPGRHREGHHPRRHREDRHRRRAGLRARVPRQRHPRALDGGAHDDLQHVDRGRRPRRHGRARRDDVRLPRRAAPHAPQGQDWDDAVAYWRTLATDEGAVFDAEVFLDADALEPFVTWGTNPGQGVSLSETSCPTRRLSPTRNERAAAERALEYMDLDAGHAAEGHRGRRGLHGLVHEQPHRRPARLRLDHQGQARRPTACASWSSRAPRACASRPRPRASTRCSRSSAPSGASPAARCASA